MAMITTTAMVTPEAVTNPVTPVTDSVTVPPLVVADLRSLRLTVAKLTLQTQADSAEKLALYQRDSTRLWQIESRDKLIRELSKPRCGKRCGFLLGVAAVVVVRKAVE